MNLVLADGHCRWQPNAPSAVLPIAVAGLLEQRSVGLTIH